MQQCLVNYLETCAPVLNWISVRSLLSIASINELPIISMDFLPAFLQADLDVDVFVDIPLGIVVDVN